MYAVLFDGAEIKAAVWVGLLTVENYCYFKRFGCFFMSQNQIENYLLNLRRITN